MKNIIANKISDLSPDGFSLAVDDGVGRHDAVRGGVGLHDLELDRAHAAADDEGVALVDGAVRLQEVGLQVHLEPVSGQS